MSIILLILIIFALPLFFRYVEYKWKKDNNLMLIHVEKDFNLKLQRIMIEEQLRRQSLKNE